MNAPVPAAHLCKRILVACIGNIFFGDDGFGVEVAKQLLGRQNQRYPENVHIIDFGIRGIELAYTLLEDYDTLVLVDIVSRGGSPGTLYVLEPELPCDAAMQGMRSGSVALDGHSMDPVKVLTLARTLGAPSMHTLLVGCEPATQGTGTVEEEMSMGLSEPVQAAIAAAIQMIDEIIENFLSVSAAL